MTTPRTSRPEKRCGDYGHKNRDGAPCRLWPIHGGTVCHKHGGRAPQVRKKAAERVFAAQVTGYLRDIEVEPVIDPLRRLTELIGEADAFYRFVAAKVGELSLESWETYDDKGAIQLSAMVTVLERAMERVQKFCADMARLGIEERLAKVDEKLAERVVAALDRAMAEADIDPDMRGTLRAATGRHLRVA